MVYDFTEGEHGDDAPCADDVVDEDYFKDYDRGFVVLGSEEVGDDVFGDDVFGNVVTVAHGRMVGIDDRDEARCVGDGYDVGVTGVADSCTNEPGIRGVELRTETEDAAFGGISGSKAVEKGLVGMSDMIKSDPFVGI